MLDCAQEQKDSHFPRRRTKQQSDSRLDGGGADEISHYYPDTSNQSTIVAKDVAVVVAKNLFLFLTFNSSDDGFFDGGLRNVYRVLFLFFAAECAFNTAQETHHKGEHDSFSFGSQFFTDLFFPCGFQRAKPTGDTFYAMNTHELHQVASIFTCRLWAVVLRNQSQRRRRPLRRWLV